MKSFGVATSVAILMSSPETALGDSDVEAATPISKVLELMNQMVAKTDARKKADEVEYSSFSTWCTNEQRIKNDEISKANTKMEDLSAFIDKSAANIERLTDRIEELEEDIGRWKKDQASAAEVRGKERTDYQAVSTDYGESVQAVAGALTAVQKQASNVPQFLQVQKESLRKVSQIRSVPDVARRALLSFIQEDSEEDAGPDERLLRGSPEANAYESQSGGVVDLLDGLRRQFRQKSTDLDTDEANAQHAFEQIMQQLTDNIENAQYEIDKKTKLRGQTEQEKADAEGDLAQTTADRDEDQKYVDETGAMCQQKTNDYETKQQLQADELSALNKAIEIMSSDAVKGSGEKHLPQLLQISQTRAGTALVQQEVTNSQNAMQVRLAAFFSERAKLYNSQLLLGLSQRVAADPFTKIKKMIKDLTWKIMEEATAETEHKGWCDTELGTNKQTRDKKTSDSSNLMAQKDELTADIQQLNEDIEALTTALKELADSVATAQQERADAKAKNDATVDDAKGAQTAVEAAIAVLKDFYDKNGGPAVLVQEGTHADVVSFLEVIMSDFSRLESDTTAAEDAEVAEFKKFMFESDKDRALKENEMKHRSDKKTAKENDLQSTDEELKTTQQELQAAMDYFDKLKPSCVDAGVSYDDRVKRREAEMQSLKEALEILQQQR